MNRDEARKYLLNLSDQMPGIMHMRDAVMTLSAPDEQDLEFATTEALLHALSKRYFHMVFFGARPDGRGVVKSYSGSCCMLTGMLWDGFTDMSAKMKESDDEDESGG